jgi:hypothetical protein
VGRGHSHVCNRMSPMSARPKSGSKVGGGSAAPGYEQPDVSGISDRSIGMPSVVHSGQRHREEPCGAIMAPQWRHNGARMRNMPSVQIKAVPEDVHAELRRRAEQAGKSLQEYLLGRLIEEARRPSLDDLLDRAGGHKGGHVSFRFASEAVREDRDAS